MRLLLVGGTGRTGRHVLQMAIDDGHQVKALVRDPARLGPLRECVEVVEGTAADPAALDRAVEGCEAVISTLAPTSPGLLGQFAERAAESMRRHGVRRLVVLSPPTVKSSGDRPTAVQKLMRLAFTRIKPQVVADHQRQATVLASTDLDWTVVRSVLIVDKEPGRKVQVGAFDRSAGRNMSRADLARFLVDTATRGGHERQVLLVSQA